MDQLDLFHIYPPHKEPIEKVCKGGARKKPNITEKTTKTWDRDWTNPPSVTFKMGPVGFVLLVEPVSSSLMLPIGTRSDTDVSPLRGSGNRLWCFRKLSSSHPSVGSKAKSSFPPKKAFSVIFVLLSLRKCHPVLIKQSPLASTLIFVAATIILARVQSLLLCRLLLWFLGGDCSRCFLQLQWCWLLTRLRPSEKRLSWSFSRWMCKIVDWKS